jgi:hypothetical protein
VSDLLRQFHADGAAVELAVADQGEARRDSTKPSSQSTLLALDQPRCTYASSAASLPPGGTRSHAELDFMVNLIGKERDDKNK